MDDWAEERAREEQQEQTHRMSTQPHAMEGTTDIVDQGESRVCVCVCVCVHGCVYGCFVVCDDLCVDIHCSVCERQHLVCHSEDVHKTKILICPHPPSYYYHL